MSTKKESLKKWRSLDVVALNSELQELTNKQFKLRMQHAIGELKATHNIKNTRRSIARILGVLAEKAI